MQMFTRQGQFAAYFLTLGFQDSRDIPVTPVCVTMKSWFFCINRSLIIIWLIFFFSDRQGSQLKFHFFNAPTFFHWYCWWLTSYYLSPCRLPEPLPVQRCPWCSQEWLAQSPTSARGFPGHRVELQPGQRGQCHGRYLRAGGRATSIPSTRHTHLMAN